MPGPTRTSWRHIIFWSVISAAFIGPGTVTTAAAAGAQYNLALGWALLFSVIGCLVLQEAAARLAIVGGLSLGQALGSSRYIVVIAVAFGCMAYEAGNLLGAYKGISLWIDAPQWFVVFGLGLLAAILLSGQTQRLAQILGALVLLLGLAFLLLAFGSPINLSELGQGLVLPSFPSGSTLLAVGLVGTTIVPYNLFLGNSLGQKNGALRPMRVGLTISILLGGVFSVAIMVVGTQLPGSFSFEALSQHLNQAWGSMGVALLSFGLLIAGFTSSLTAPLAAALATRSLMPTAPEHARRKLYKGTWLFILGVGMILGMTNLKVVPVIIMAQAFNGFVLPIVVGFLFWAVNQKEYLGEETNTPIANVVLGLILAVSLFLGMLGLVKAWDSTFGTQAIQSTALRSALLIMAIVGTAFIAFITLRRK